MEASKFYELEKSLPLLRDFLFKQEDRDKVDEVIKIVKREISEYEFERDAKIRADVESDERSESEEVED